MDPKNELLNILDQGSNYLIRKKMLAMFSGDESFINPVKPSIDIETGKYRFGSGNNRMGKQNKYTTHTSQLRPSPLQRRYRYPA